MSDQNLHELAVEVYETIREELTDNHMHFQTDEDNLVITLMSIGDDLPMPIIIEVIEDRQVFRILSPIPAKMPEDKRIDGALAVAAANYGLINGSFDYDIRDGEIRYRVTAGYHGTKISKELFHYMLAIVLNTVDRYNDKFYAIAKGMSTLDDFLSQER